MVKVDYNTRLVADAEFIMWLIEKDKLAFLKLTKIKASSKHYKKQHNVILTSDVETVLEAGKIKENTLRGAFKGVSLPEEILQNTDLSEVDQKIVYSINLASHHPFNTTILTAPGKLDAYLSSAHIKSVGTVSIKSGIDGIAVIEMLYRRFNQERELSR